MSAAPPGEGSSRPPSDSGSTAASNGTGWFGALRSRSPAHLWFFLAVAVVLVGSFLARVEYSNRIVPYCHHVDEDSWMHHSIEMVKNSDLNPHRFTKPSTMAYLNTVGVSLGLVRAGAHREDVYTPSRLRSSGYPHYNSPTVIKTVRTLYIALSVLTLWMGMLCVRQVTGSRAIALLALVLMAGSSTYFRYAWFYLNVDLLGCFSATLALYFALVRARHFGPWTVTLVSGALTGLTIGTKYNLFWIAVPMALHLTAPGQRHRLERLVAFVGTTLLAFAVTSPFAILDLNAFLSHAGFEAHHYASGHRGRTIDAGWLMFLRHLRELNDALGWMVLATALFGIVQLARRDLRATVVLFSYPVLLLIYMVQQRTFFARNTLILLVFLPMASAMGLGELFRLGSLWLARRFPGASSRLRSWSVAGALAALFLAAAPYKRIAKDWDPQVESRNDVTDWLLDHAASKKTKVLVPRELEMDTSRLAAGVRVVHFRAKAFDLRTFRRQHPGALLLAPAFAQKKQDFRLKGTKKLVQFGRGKVDLQGENEGRKALVRAGNPKIRVVRL